ncbi:MAG: hypothetical protein WBI20_14875 [Burkholderiaceae bacterium]
MGVTRTETLTINRLSAGLSAFGEQSTTETTWFETRARVSETSNSVKGSEKYRLYSKLMNFTLNYTPNMKQVVTRQDEYALSWAGKSWRIVETRETIDRMSVILLCARHDPQVAV